MNLKGCKFRWSNKKTYSDTQSKMGFFEKKIMEIPFLKLFKFGSELENKLKEKPCTEK